MRYAVLAGAIVLGLAGGALALQQGGASTGPYTAFPPALIRADEITNYQVFVPGIGRDAFASEVALSHPSAFQGGAVMVTVTHALSGSMSALGRQYALAPDGSGGLVGFIGVGTDDPVGPADVAISATDEQGELLSFDETLTVTKTNWTVDSFDLPPPPPPDPNDPVPPPPPPNDNLILPTIYAGVTPRQWLDHWALPLAEPNLKICDPASPPILACVSGYFGEQRSINGGPIQGHHGGTDIATAAGTPIHATNNGTVVVAGLYLVRGNLVVIDHGGGVFSAYGHMSAIAVTVGQVVHQGDVIGYVGTTGQSTGPHLHWEISVGGVLVDALRWLDGSQGF